MSTAPITSSQPTTLTRRADSSGFGPLLRKELQTWWGGRRWLYQGLLWQFVINGLLLMVLFVIPAFAPEEATGLGDDSVLSGLQGFFSIGGLALAIGVIVLAGDALTAEIQSGTAEWLLTKPISRRAFVLAKLAANTLGMAIVLIALPGLVAFGLLMLVGRPDLAGFAAGLVVLLLHTFFYLALTFMVATLTRNRNIVLAVSLGAVLGGQVLFSLLGLLPIASIALVTPWPLAAVAVGLASGSPLPPELVIPIAATAAWSAVFIAITLWRFERLEL